MTTIPPHEPHDESGETSPPGPRFLPPAANPFPTSSQPPSPTPPPGPRFVPPPPPTPQPPVAPQPASTSAAPQFTAPGPTPNQPLPPAGTPQFVSTPTERPRLITNTYDHERATWGLGDMFTSLGVYFFGAVALILLVFVGGGANDDGLPEGPWLLLAVVGPHTLLLAHLFWVSRKKGISFADDFQLRFRWSDAGLGLGLFFGALVAAGIVAVAITEITGEQPTAAATDLAQDSGEGGLTIWLYLFALLGATFIPVVEELVYRGLFWSALEKRGMRPWPILFITSAVFAIIHLEPVRTAVLFVVGMAIGVGRLITGRVGASIAVHIFINSMAMIATLVQLA